MFSLSLSPSQETSFPSSQLERPTISPQILGACPFFLPVSKAKVKGFVGLFLSYLRTINSSEMEMSKFLAQVDNVPNEIELDFLPLTGKHDWRLPCDANMMLLGERFYFLYLVYKMSLESCMYAHVLSHTCNPLNGFISAAVYMMLARVNHASISFKTISQ